MHAALRRIADELDDMLVALDPAALHARDAVTLLEDATAIERRAAAIRTLVADRAADAAEWTRGGYRGPEEWLAQKTGTSYGAAKDTLETSAKLEDLPSTNEALRKGELSGAQINEIGPAANPENEQRLLGAAKRESFKGLKGTCAKEKAKARPVDDAAARHAAHPQGAPPPELDRCRGWLLLLGPQYRDGRGAVRRRARRGGRKGLQGRPCRGPA